MFDLVKDFAGPSATIIASIVAGTIAVVFAVKQRDIAFQQKEIAKEKLRLDLYDRRYRLYATIFDYYNALLGWHGSDKDREAEKRFFLAYKESMFLFGEEIQGVFGELRNAGAKVVGFKENKDAYKSDPKFFLEKYNEMTDILVKQFEVKLHELTEACQRYIGFQHSGIRGGPNTQPRGGGRPPNKWIGRTLTSAQGLVEDA